MLAASSKCVGTTPLEDEYFTPQHSLAGTSSDGLIHASKSAPFTSGIMGSQSVSECLPPPVASGSGQSSPSVILGSSFQAADNSCDVQPSLAQKRPYDILGASGMSAIESESASVSRKWPRVGLAEKTNVMQAGFKDAPCSHRAVLLENGSSFHSEGVSGCVDLRKFVGAPPMDARCGTIAPQFNSARFSLDGTSIFAPELTGTAASQAVSTCPLPPLRSPPPPTPPPPPPSAAFASPSSDHVPVSPLPYKSNTGHEKYQAFLDRFVLKSSGLDGSNVPRPEGSEGDDLIRAALADALSSHRIEKLDRLQLQMLDFAIYHYERAQTEAQYIAQGYQMQNADAAASATEKSDSLVQPPTMGELGGSSSKSHYCKDDLVPDDLLGEAVRGVVFSFNYEKRFGFIRSQEVRHIFDHDIFVHMNDLRHFEVGDVVQFTVAAGKKAGKPRARHLQRIEGEVASAIIERELTSPLER